MSACTNGKLNLASLGLVSNRFELIQGGKPTGVAKLNMVAQTASFSLTCPKDSAKLSASFDGGTNWETIATLDCSTGTASVVFDPASATTLADPLAATFPAILRAVDSEGTTKTRDLSVTFARPVFDSPSLAAVLEGGAGKTKNIDVSIAVFAKEVAGSLTLSPSEVYTTPLAGCGSGGAWVPYASQITATLAQPNATNFVNLKFRDEAGNESACLQRSILHDGVPPTSPSIAINSGAPQTSSPNVTVSLSAFDSPVEMNVSATGDCSGSSNWVPYATTLPWTLPGLGTNTLSVKFRDDVGNESACVAASILYNTHPPAEPTSLTLATGTNAVDHKNPVTVLVSPVLDGDTADLYTDAACATASVASAVGYGGRASVPVSVAPGTATYYAKVTGFNGEVSPCSSAHVSYTYDGTAPTILSVSSPNADADYHSGASIPITVTFSEPVVVTGTDATLALKLIGQDALAIYAGGSGTATLTFDYVVRRGDVSADLDVTGAGAIALNSSRLRDPAGNDAVLTLPYAAQTNSLASLKDLKVNYTATVESVVFPSDNLYYSGDKMDVVVRWSAPVTVTGSPKLTLTGPAMPASFAYDALRSNSQQSVFSTNLTGAMASATGLTASALNLNGGTIKDSFGNDADLVFAPFAAPGVVTASTGAFSVHLDAAAATYSESAGGASLGISLNLSQSQPVTVQYKIAKTALGDASGTTLTDGSVTIPAGQTNASVPFSIADTPDAQGARGFSIALTSSTSGRLGLTGGGNTKRITITDSNFSGDTIAELATGFSHACARYASGKLVCWGSNTMGQLGGSPDTANKVTVFTFGVTKVVAAGDSTCAIVTGLLYCWGANTAGVLGIGSTAAQAVPTLVAAIAEPLDISISDAHACAVFGMGIGSVTCWGQNTSGEVGKPYSSSPVLTPNPASPVISSGATKVSVGGLHSCAIVSGSLVCWGRGLNGELATGSMTNSYSPIAASGGSYIAPLFDVAAGYNSTCVIDSMNQVYCAGTTAGFSNASTLTNVSALSGSIVTKLARGAYYLTTGLLVAPTGGGYCAITMTGQTYCWGSLQSGVLPVLSSAPISQGAFSSTDVSFSTLLSCFTDSINVRCTGTSSTFPITPLGIGDFPLSDRGVRRVPVTIDSSVDNVTSSSNTSCLRTTTGGIRCAGAYPGDGVSSSRTNSVPVFASGVSKIVSGETSSCALRDDQTLWCWGSGGGGGVGDGTSTSRPLPIYVMSDVQDVKIGSDTICALKTSDDLYCWSRNNSGSAGIGTNAAVLLPTATGLQHVTSFALGYAHVCAIADRVLQCAGYNSYGALGDATTTNRNSFTEVSLVDSEVPTAISAGYSHTCGLFGAGLVRCWGQGAYGQLGIGGNPLSIPLPFATILTGATKIMSAFHTSCALKSDATLWCWGQNSGVIPGSSKGIENAPVQVMSGVADAELFQGSTGGAGLFVKKQDGTKWAFGAGAPALLPRRTDTALDYLVGF